MADGRDFEVSNYGIFNDAHQTNSSLCEKINGHSETIKQLKAKIPSASLFLGPICDCCVDALASVVSANEVNVSDLTSIGTYLVQACQAYENGDVNATKVVCNLSHSTISGSPIDSALDWALWVANDTDMVYRWGGGHGDGGIYGYDCSGLVSTALVEAGIFPPGSAYDTSGLARVLPRSGFTCLGPAPTDPSSLQPGDIILNPSQHVEMYAGDGQIVGARNGNGTDICTTDYKSYFSNGYYIYRYTGGTQV